MEPICMNCIYWKRKTEWDDDTKQYIGQKSGDCMNDEKFVYDQDCPEDGLMYWDAESYHAGFRTGERFGCIHFKAR